MPRPPLAIGTYGEIYTKEVSPGRWLARVQYRDADGETRPVKRHGASKAKAIAELKKALTERIGSVHGGQFSPDMKIADLAAKWFTEIRRLADEGQRSPTTVDQYEGMWERRIKTAFAELRCREVDPLVGGVTIVHDFLVAVGKDSRSNAKMARSVLSGMFAFAVPRRALTANPVRDVGSIEVQVKRTKRAITAAEILEFHGKLIADEKAVRWSLPDLTTFMAATGARIGEALAVSWDDVDFTAGAVDITHRMIRVKGKGLVRAEKTKRETGDRLLGLPGWCLTMLKRRRLASGGAVPVFADSYGGWRDPSNTRRVLRDLREDLGYGWITSHAYRRGVATILDNGGATARAVADQLGHAQVSMTQNHYLARQVSNAGAVAILEQAVGFESPQRPS
jgi:integrase